MHLTNASVQKNHPKYKEEKETSIKDFSFLAKHFVEQGAIKSEADLDLVKQKIDEICRLTFEAVKPRLD